MGGGDLNLKKSWHTQTLANQERVWKAEQKAEEEKRRVDQMLKEKKEEREKEELRELQKQAGLIKRGPERVEWMYAAPNQKGIVDEEKEAFLLGKRRADKLLKDTAAPEKVDTIAHDVNALDFSNTGISAANRHRDMQNKTRDDPLLAIKKREAASLKEKLDNPIALKRLKEDAKIAKSERKAARQAERDRRQRRKEGASRHTPERPRS